MQMINWDRLKILKFSCFASVRSETKDRATIVIESETKNALALKRQIESPSTLKGRRATDRPITIRTVKTPMEQNRYKAEFYHIVEAPGLHSGIGSSTNEAIGVFIRRNSKTFGIQIKEEHL